MTRLDVGYSYHNGAIIKNGEKPRSRTAPTRAAQILYTKLTQGAPRRRRTPGQCTSRDRARARFLGRVVVVPEARARELEALRELRR